MLTALQTICAFWKGATLLESLQYGANWMLVNRSEKILRNLSRWKRLNTIEQLYWDAYSTTNYLCILERSNIIGMLSA